MVGVFIVVIIDIMFCGVVVGVILIVLKVLLLKWFVLWCFESCLLSGIV